MFIIFGSYNLVLNAECLLSFLKKQINSYGHKVSVCFMGRLKQNVPLIMRNIRRFRSSCSFAKYRPAFALHSYIL